MKKLKRRCGSSIGKIYFVLLIAVAFITQQAAAQAGPSIQKSINYPEFFILLADESQPLIEMLTKIDQNGDGALSEQELRDYFNSLWLWAIGVNHDELAKLLVKTADIAGQLDGHVPDHEITVNEVEIFLAIARNIIDENHDGKLSPEEKENGLKRLAEVFGWPVWFVDRIKDAYMEWLFILTFLPRAWWKYVLGM